MTRGAGHAMALQRSSALISRPLGKDQMGCCPSASVRRLRPAYISCSDIWPTPDKGLALGRCEHGAFGHHSADIILWIVGTAALDHFAPTAIKGIDLSQLYWRIGPGESDQGVPARPLRRSHLDCHDAGQSAAAVARIDGPRSTLCGALRRVASHAVCQRNLRHHSSQAAQDRGARTRQCPPRLNRDGVELSRSSGPGLRCRSSQCRRRRAWLAGLTRATSARHHRKAIGTPLPPRLLCLIPSLPKIVETRLRAVRRR